MNIRMLLAASAVMCCLFHSAAYALLLGQVVNDYPAPVCAQALPFTYDSYPMKTNTVGVDTMSAIDGYTGLRLNDGTNQPYVTNLTARSGAWIDLSPQLETGGNMAGGNHRLLANIGGKIVWVTMQASTMRYYAAARAMQQPASNQAIYYYYVDNQLLSNIPPAQYANEGDALQYRRVMPLQLNPQISGRGSLSVQLYGMAMPNGYNNILVDYYTIGTWFYTSPTTGVQYCGKGMRYYSYAMKATVQ